MSAKLRLLIGAGILLALAILFFRFTDAGTSILWQVSDGGQLLLPLILVAAAIDSINPCAFSILFLTIGFLVSIGALRRKIFTLGAAYVLGLFVVYVLIGLGIIGAFHIFNTPHFMAKLGATLLIALGVINLVGEFFPAFPIRLKIPHVAHHRMAVLMERGSAPAVFLLGSLVGLCEFPCTGGPYLMILGLLHDQGTYASGFGYLLLYNVIFILPLILILGVASDARVLLHIERWQRERRRAMKIGTSVAMVALGTVMFFL